MNQDFTKKTGRYQNARKNAFTLAKSFRRTPKVVLKLSNFIFCFNIF